MDWMHPLRIAKESALTAGAKIMEIYENADMTQAQTKADGSPLTQADLASNDAIAPRLRADFPTHALLTEEEKDDKQRIGAEWVWIVDPLDGTKEFISRNGEFTVNIGLVRDGLPVLGVIYIPVKGELYWAAEGHGAWKQVGDDEPKRLHASKRTSIEEMTLVASRSHAGEQIKRLMNLHSFADVKSRGSSLKGCLIATGEADVYYRFGPTCEWDICAMHAIVAEAGGAMTDLEGRPMTYNRENPKNAGFVASNGAMHDRFVEMAREVNA